MTPVFPQLVIDGLSSGAVYAALALALVLIYRATRIVNFGQGEMATFTAFIAWQLMQSGMSPWIALPLVAALAFVLGAAVFQFVVRPVLAAPVETVVVATLGLLLMFQALCLWFWGSDQRQFVDLFTTRSWNVVGVRITAYNLGVIGSVSVLALGMTLFFRFTRMGLSMRAAASERDKSLLVGISVDRTLLLGWGIAAVVGFCAAVLVAPKIFLAPSMMVPVLLYSLASANIGGWSSPLGAILSGLVVGVLESLGSTYLPFIGPELRLVVPLALLLLVLLVRPAGIFGVRETLRA